MNHLNKITIIGNLVRDAEIRSTPSGAIVMVCAICHNYSYNSGGTWHSRPTFIEFEVWGNYVQNLCEKMQKGLLACVEGRLQQHDWTDNGGQKRSNYKIVADRVYVFKLKQDDLPDQNNGQQRSDNPDPAPTSQRPQNVQQPPPFPTDGTNSGNSFDVSDESIDDIPF